MENKQVNNKLIHLHRERGGGKEREINLCSDAVSFITVVQRAALCFSK